jgi:hypothetical protein
MNEKEMTPEDMRKQLEVIALQVVELKSELHELPNRMASAARQGLAARIEDLKLRRSEIPELLRALEIRSTGLRISVKELEIEETKERAEDAREQFELADQRLQEIHKKRLAADEDYRRTQAETSILHNAVVVQQGDVNRMREELQKLVAAEFKANERVRDERKN